MSHANPSKNFGEDVAVFWPMRNDGGSPGSGHLRINSQLGMIANGPLVEILPGAQVSLVLVTPPLVDGTHAIAGANSCNVQMLRADGTIIAMHDFTLTMAGAPPGGAILVAVGDPIIS
jgi:hypothetical protein